MGIERIRLGFEASERTKVGALYWEAFQRKLRPAFADSETGLLIIRTSMRSEQFLVARSVKGAVIGVCGFHEGGTGAAAVTWATLRSLLSAGQALRASLILGLLERKGEAGVLVLDGICVDSNQRSSGIGTALLQSAEAHARKQGMASVRLSVIDRNPRARALYERRGFVPVSEGTMGILGPVYGFDRYTVMSKELAS